MTSEQEDLSRTIRDAAIELGRPGLEQLSADLHRARILVETLYVRIETLEEELRQFKLNFWN